MATSRYEVGRFFNLGEVKCHHCGGLPPMMGGPSFTDFVDTLDSLRLTMGRPVIVNSWYRCPLHPIEKAKPEPGVHSTGLAVDLRLDGSDTLWAIQILTRGTRHSQMGFGVSQRKGRPRYLHFDIGGCRHRWAGIRPNIWSY